MRTDMRHRACAIAVVVLAVSWMHAANAAAQTMAAANAAKTTDAASGSGVTAQAAANTTATTTAAAESGQRHAELAAPSPWSGDAAAQLTRLEEQTVLLKAQIRKLDAQAEVAQRTAALARLGSAATMDPVSQSVRVVAIEGLGRRYTAVVQTGDGQRFDVASGDELPNGMKIVSVGANDVVGRWSNGQTTRLVPVLAARSGAVLTDTGAGMAGAYGGAGALRPGATASVNALAPAADRPGGAGLPPVYQTAP